MDNRTRVLQLLADGNFHSGESIGSKLSISRSAVWKLIHSLEKYDLEICSVKGKGYSLPTAIEFLDQKNIYSLIGKTRSKSKIKLTVFKELESTNQYLLDRSLSTSIHGHAIFSEYQSAGRGRRGSKWFSPYGSGINMSIGWHFDSPVISMMQLSIATGVAIIRTLNKFNITDAGLKWPNDILINGKKLAGILIEMRGESAGPCDVIIGIGLNVNLPAKLYSDKNYKWIDIASVSTPVPSRNKLAAKLVIELVKLLENYDDKCIKALIDEWRQYDCTHGQLVTLLLPGKSVIGRATGIDDNGSLLLSVNDVIQSFTAGEISMRLQS